MSGAREDDPLIKSAYKSRKAEYSSKKDRTSSPPLGYQSNNYEPDGEGDDECGRDSQVLFGTKEGAIIWLNTSDPIGIIFASIVWVAVLYAVTCWAILYANGDILLSVFIPVVLLVFMALWSHIVVMTGDPGAVPWNAHPIEIDKKKSPEKLQICGHCDAYKPPLAHHDRVSGRCISRMDHFCPWMNNAIGAGNQKNFILFLIYTDVTSIFMYTVLSVHLIDDNLAFSGAGLAMARGLIFVLLFAILFTSSMIANQLYGIITGLGTIDRMKLKGDDKGYGTTIPWSHVFGETWLPWILPINPHFSKPEKVFRYKTKTYAYGRSV